MDLGQFKVQKSILEIRYAQSFLIWDRTGHIWSQMFSKFPEMKVQKAQPNQQTLVLGNKMAATVALESANLAAHHLPTNFAPFASACDEFFPIVLSELGVTDLSRIGFRTFFEKSFSSREEATEFAASQFPVFRRSGKAFNIEGAILDPEFSLRWEGETTGITVRLKSQQQKLETEIPAEFDDLAASINVERNVLILDVDYYAHANTSVRKFNSKALIESWAHVIRRDLIGFING
jgi:hypothetical protein